MQTSVAAWIPKSELECRSHWCCGYQGVSCKCRSQQRHRYHRVSCACRSADFSGGMDTGVSAVCYSANHTSLTFYLWICELVSPWQAGSQSPPLCCIPFDTVFCFFNKLLKGKITSKVIMPDADRHELFGTKSVN